MPQVLLDLAGHVRGVVVQATDELSIPQMPVQQGQVRPRRVERLGGVGDARRFQGEEV